LLREKVIVINSTAVRRARVVVRRRRAELAERFVRIENGADYSRLRGTRFDGALRASSIDNNVRGHSTSALFHRRNKARLRWKKNFSPT